MGPFWVNYQNKIDKDEFWGIVQNLPTKYPANPLTHSPTLPFIPYRANAAMAAANPRPTTARLPAAGVAGVAVGVAPVPVMELIADVTAAPALDTIEEAAAPPAFSATAAQI